METSIPNPVLITETEGIRGVNFTVRKLENDTEQSMSKLVNPFAVMRLVSNLQEYAKHIAYIIDKLVYYHEYVDKIDDIIAEQAADRSASGRREYSVGGNFAFFTQSKRTVAKDLHMADNNTAARIIKKEYTADYPNHRITFDAESSYCYAYAPTQKEAKRFLHWMDKHYFKPFVDSYAEDIPEFENLWNSATEEDHNQLLKYLLH